VTEAVEFRRVAYSIQDLDEAVEDLSKSLPKGSWSFMGPDYVKNSVTVTVPKSQLDSFADGITVDGYPDMQVNVLEGEFAVAV
jgi:hypothetical protein